MQTSPHCLNCFAKQASYSAKLATDNLALRQEIEEKAARLIDGFDMNLSPPENAIYLYRMIAEKSGCPDIFADIKSLSNRKALDLLPGLGRKVEQSSDPLRTAALLAIAGNIIDYGANHDFDVRSTIDKCLHAKPAIDDLELLRSDLAKAGKILYLGDNCGEIAFDRLLIGQIRKEITYAVKGRPIINDALREDAKTCGLDDLCRIISNGTDCPGTPLEKCGKEFKEIFAEADLIISKGQGNFETLSEVSAPIYFLMMVKCEVVAEHAAELTGRPAGSIKTGDLALMKNRKFRPGS